MTRGPVFRARGLPALRPDDELKEALKDAIHGNLSENERSIITIQADIVPSCYDHDGQRVALVEFGGGVPGFLAALMADPMASWQMEMGDDDVNFDVHFFGFTQLYRPKADAPITAEYVTVSRLWLAADIVHPVSSLSPASMATHMARGRERATWDECGCVIS